MDISDLTLKFRRICLVFFFTGFSLLSVGQTNPVNFSIGKTYQFPSEILKENRMIHVYTPPGYADSGQPCPVLFLLDGDLHFLQGCGIVEHLSNNARIPQMIVVAIPNTDRDRDFTPNHVNVLPTSGGAGKFLRFLEEELIPFIDKEYKTCPYRILYGHSLCGMFTVYNLFAKPDLFGGYIAASPALMNDFGYVLQYAEEQLKKRQPLKKFLYLVLGNEPFYVESLETFQRLLKKYRPEGLEWDFLHLTEEGHGSVTHRALYNGLETLYSGWRFPVVQADKGLDAVKEFYEGLTDRYGYPIQISEGLMNRLGYRALGKNKLKDAIDFFIYNIELNPESPNAYDSLGEAYEAAGKLELAKVYYEKACHKAMGNYHPGMPAYKEHLDRVLKLMKE